jgi:hypothetical protein
MGFKPGKLALAQPEMVLFHQRSPFGDVESENQPCRNPLYGSGIRPALAQRRQVMSRAGSPFSLTWARVMTWLLFMLCSIAQVHHEKKGYPSANAARIQVGLFDLGLRM